MKQNNKTSESKLKKPLEYLKESFEIYTKKENFIFFAKVMAVLTIIFSIFNYSLAYFYPDNSWSTIDPKSLNFLGLLSLSLASLLVGIWVSATRYVLVMSKPNQDVKKIFLLGYERMGKYLLVSLAAGLLTIIGIILLIIPGIVVSVWLSFVSFLVIDKNLGVKEALKTSKKMVKGNFWALLGRFIVFGLVIGLIQIIIGSVDQVGSIVLNFLSPLFTLPFLLVYRDLAVDN